MSAYSYYACPYCGANLSPCLCTREETEARAASDAAWEAHYHAEETGRKPVVIEDDYSDLGHRSYPPHHMAWEMEALHDA